MKWNQCVLEVWEKPQVLNMTAGFFLIYSKLAVTSINTSFSYFMVAFFLHEVPRKPQQALISYLWLCVIKCQHTIAMTHKALVGGWKYTNSWFCISGFQTHLRCFLSCLWFFFFSFFFSSSGPSCIATHTYIIMSVCFVTSYGRHRDMPVWQ